MKPEVSQSQSEYSVVAVQLQVVVARLMRTIRHHGAAGLTPSQISALATLAAEGPLRISQLALQESVGAPAATRVVATLEDLGFVVRSNDLRDGRVCLVELSVAGRAMLEGLWSERTIGMSSRLASLSSLERSTLVEALVVLEKMTHDT